MTALVPLMVILPLLGAATALIFGRSRRAQIAISAITLSVVTVIAAVLLIWVDAHGAVSVQVGAWLPPWGIVLVVDRLSAILLLVSALMLVGVLAFAIGQGVSEGDMEAPVTIFHPTYLILSAGVFIAFVAGDLFNLYVGFEVLLSASYVLITLRGTEQRIRAGVTYIVVSLVSSILFLAAIAMIYAATGTVTIAEIALRVAELPTDVQLLLHIMLLVAFGIKAAVFPLSFWLPDSYPNAPAPVTAVFAGLLTKVGIYAIIRTETVMFPGGALAVPMMILAVLSMVIGILGAIAQADIKRLLSFTLVSHIGYMLFGIALGTHLAMTATIYYVVHHIMVQTTLFLAAGLVERLGGATSMHRLGGLLAASPVVAILFFIPALNLGGIPPFSGFLGKVGLFQAAAAEGGWLVWVVVAAGAITSLLTLYALMRVWNLAFWRSKAEIDGYSSPLIDNLADDSMDDGIVRTRTTPRLMIAVTASMVALTVALTVFAGPLFDLADRAAEGVRTPADYISTVYPDGSPYADVDGGGE